MDSVFWETMRITFCVALLTTMILFPIGIFLGYYLSRSKSNFKLIIEVLVWLPLVLPPSVLGFYLLVLFSPQGFIGSFLSAFDIKLVFSFEGIVLASVVFGVPFMVNSLKSGFESVPMCLEQSSFILGKGKIQTLFRVILPNMKSSILLGCVSTFVHAVGEFGVVMMIGGNIDGVTKVASIAIYDEVESLNYALAHKYAFSLFFVSFIMLLLIFYINKKYLRVNPNDRA